MIEEYECVKIKRRAQERIYTETSEMTPEQLVTYYHRMDETLRQRQAELRAKGNFKKT